jgi:hypothetical protein
MSPWPGLSLGKLFPRAIPRQTIKHKNNNKKTPKIKTNKQKRKTKERKKGRKKEK